MLEPAKALEEYFGIWFVVRLDVCTNVMPEPTPINAPAPTAAVSTNPGKAADLDAAIAAAKAAKRLAETVSESSHIDNNSEESSSIKPSDSKRIL